MSDYIPSDEAGKILWLTNFAAWLSAHGAGHGFSPAEIFDLNGRVSGATSAVANNVTQQAAARAATAAKNAAITSAIDLARDDAQRLQTAPGMTDAERAAAGITILDVTPTPGAGGGAGGILTIPPPLLLLDFSVRRQVTVHWGTNPANEHQNARPSGTIGCQVQAARGGIPTDEALWIPLEIDTESPLIHTVNETAPITFAYRARYVGRSLKFGPFGDPVVCTVSV